MSWLNPRSWRGDLLDQLLAAGHFTELDCHFARCLASGSKKPELLLTLALISRADSEGQICLPLDQLCRNISEMDPATERITTTGLQNLLSASGLLGSAQQGALLHCHRGMLYTAKWFTLEQSVLHSLWELQKTPPAVEDTPLAASLLQELFPRPGRQRTAAALMLCSRLAVLSGGPGTGKTTTMAGILQLLQRMHDARQKAGAPELPLAIVLAAPTGKAAARMQEALHEHSKSHTLGHLPAASTLHRLLGIHPGSQVPSFHAMNPLDLDVLVVDEVSMVDLRLMSLLLAALPPHARLLLIGDPNQLSSVEAGSVLAEMCPDPWVMNPSLQPVLQRMLEKDELDSLPFAPDAHSGSAFQIHLNVSHRFAPESVFARAAEAILEGDSQKLLQQMSETAESSQKGFRCVRQDPPQSRKLAQIVEEYLPPLLQTPEADDALILQALRQAAQLRILSSNNRGPLGVEFLNRLAAQLLYGSKGLKELQQGFSGMPLMIRQNQPATGLFNGDSGIFVTRSSQLQAAFLQSGELTILPAALLPAWQPAWATTIHKSQGSEFDRVLTVVPTGSQQLLCRELLYTALSRARKELLLLATEETLRQAVNAKFVRHASLGQDLFDSPSLDSPAPPNTKV